jgi:hypothetical protein
VNVSHAVWSEARGRESPATGDGAVAVEGSTDDRSILVAQSGAEAAIDDEGTDDADADASTVIIDDDSSSTSVSEHFSDSSSTSSALSSDEDEYSNDGQNAEQEHGVEHADFHRSASCSAQIENVHFIREVSDFMGTSPGVSDADCMHAPPEQWLARLSEAPPVKQYAAESQSVDDRLHAVNIVNVRIGILQPVFAHYDIACRAVLSMMRRDWHLDAYTKGLQHFHLMEDGAFGDSFATALFDAMDEMPLSRMLPDQFQQLLAHTLKSSQSDSHPLAHKLRLRYAPSSGHADQHDVCSDGLDRLQLVLDVTDEPAAIVLTKEVMHCYQGVFVLMLRLRRIIRIASRLFWDMPKERGGFRDPHSLEYTKTSGQRLASMRELTLFRHEISHFAHTLQSYLMTQILHISVPEFEAQQRGVRDLQQLIVVHTAFVEVQAAARFFQHRLIRVTGHYEALPSQSALRSCNVHHYFYFERNIEVPIANTQGGPSQSCSRLALSRRIPFACQFPLSSAYKTRQARVRCAYSLSSRRARLLLPSYNLHLEDILLRLDFRCFRIDLFAYSGCLTPCWQRVLQSNYGQSACMSGGSRRFQRKRHRRV